MERVFAFASYSIRSVCIRGNRSRLCIHHWLCAGDIPHVECFRTCLAPRAVQVVMESDTCEESTPVVISERFSVSLHG